MSKTLSFLFIFIFLGSLFFPLVSFAGDYVGPNGNVHYEGLVPCGKSQTGAGESQEVTNPCTLCHFFVMIDGIIKYVLYYIVPSLAALMIAIGGFLYITSRANPEMLSWAKRLFTSVGYGLLIIYGAFLIIGLFLWFIGLNVWTTDIYHNWWQQGLFQIDCH